MVPQCDGERDRPVRDRPQDFLRRPEMQAITRLLNELTSKEGTNYGLMASAVTLVIIPVIIVYIFLQKYIIKGMTAGAVKG